MKYGSLKAKRKTSSPDRRFIIGIVVITSALSFILGYFVGGAGDKEKQPQKQIVTAPKIEMELQAQEEPVTGTEPQTVNPVKDLSISGTNASQPQVAEEKVSYEKPMPVQPKEAIEPKIVTDSSNQGDIKYTVQVGAFKKLKEAEALKHKLEAKGYKTYIKKYAKSKNPKLYKVRTGEFTAKEEASEYALKLKKEGLKAFVTPKNEDARGNKNLSQSGTSKKESIR